jgi:branched-chain amino acid transport system permease protein
MLQDLVNGLLFGLTYALIAGGLSLIFGVLRIVNFAHGEFYMLGGLFLASFTGAGLAYFVALAAAVLCTVAVAVVTDRLVLRPLRQAEEVTIALATLGVSIFLANTGLILWGPVPQRINSPFSSDPISVAGIHVTQLEVFAGVLTLGTLLVLHLVIKHTAIGRQMRAVVQDRDAAALVGLNLERIYMLTFAVGCGLAAMAGGLLGTIFLVYPTMGLQAVMAAFVVVVVGGMGSLSGAVVGGMLLGVAESFGAAFLPSGYKDLVGFVMIVIVLALRPQGLLGSKQVRIR